MEDFAGEQLGGLLMTMLFNFITVFLVLQAVCTMILAGYSKLKTQRDMLWAVSALFWIAAGIWRLK